MHRNLSCKLSLNFQHCPVACLHAPIVKRSQQAAALFGRLFNHHMHTFEAFRVMMLDRSKRCRGVATVSKGGLSATTVDPKMIFPYALLSLSPTIILAHNHPCGTLKPSVEDIELTNQLVQAGRLLDICVVDHIILTRHGYFSFADHRLIT